MIAVGCGCVMPADRLRCRVCPGSKCGRTILRHAATITLCLVHGTGGDRCLSVRGHDDVAFLLRASLQVLLRQQPGLARGVADDDAALLGRLHVGLEVAADAIADGHEGKVGLVKDVPVLGGKIQQEFRQAVVVLLLLDGVVEGGVTQVLLAVGDEEGFEFWVVLPRELLAEDLLEGRSVGDAQLQCLFGVATHARVGCSRSTTACGCCCRRGGLAGRGRRDGRRSCQRSSLVACGGLRGTATSYQQRLGGVTRLVVRGRCDGSGLGAQAGLANWTSAAVAGSAGGREGRYDGGRRMDVTAARRWCQGGLRDELDSFCRNRRRVMGRVHGHRADAVPAGSLVARGHHRHRGRRCSGAAVAHEQGVQVVMLALVLPVSRGRRRRRSGSERDRDTIGRRMMLTQLGVAARASGVVLLVVGEAVAVGFELLGHDVGDVEQEHRRFLVAVGGLRLQRPHVSGEQAAGHVTLVIHDDVVLLRRLLLLFLLLLRLEDTVVDGDELGQLRSGSRVLGDQGGDHGGRVLDLRIEQAAVSHQNQTWSVQRLGSKLCVSFAAAQNKCRRHGFSSRLGLSSCGPCLLSSLP
mmetsp:Transcript_20943/g.59770  ORF Transcript_20943/g.59770 Transcript_20943/m.59770 type:complete len:580 (-) Transcript_20943:211-1950(-)